MMATHDNERLWRFALLGAILMVGCFLRFYGLDEQGFFFSDEGTFAAWGRNMMQDAPHTISARPAHALMVFLSFRLFGFSMASAVTMSAIVGMATLIVIYLLANRLYGPVAALFSCAIAATMPYLLLYHRVAMTEANCLGFMTLGFALGGMVLVSWAEANGSAPGHRAPYLFLLLAGAALGLAYDAKPPGLLGLLSLLATLLVWRVQRRLSTRSVLIAGLLLLAGAFIAHEALNLSMRHFVSHEQASSVIRREVKGFLGIGPFVQIEFQPGAKFLVHFCLFAGAMPMLLGALGAVVAIKRRNPADVCVLALAALCLAYSIRANLPLPRVHTPFLIPAVLLGGLGGASLVRMLQRLIRSCCGNAILARSRSRQTSDSPPEGQTERAEFWRDGYRESSCLTRRNPFSSRKRVSERSIAQP
ncbi:MAG: phospholipid carrier-dependent glycosyltransferase, partial [Planctomycetes bacterium]|nr:phospholipid carrier-dependent glycosyltransferase [Planctomycetota bacterium]